MKTYIALYNKIKTRVSFFSRQLKFDKFKNILGRKLAISIEDSMSLNLFKQKNGIVTKKAVYEIIQPNCSYKTMVVNMNRWAGQALIILVLLMKINRKNQHLIKHIDSTDVPVCLLKNAYKHKTMRGLAAYGHTRKGTFFGLKLHIITDLKRKLLSAKFTSGNVGDKEIVIPLSEDLLGVFVADAGYVSEKLRREFYQENKRMLIVKPYKSMKKMMTKFQEFVYRTRMLIEINFRNLKLFYGLLTSLPRSVGGYLANYIYSLLAYQII